MILNDQPSVGIVHPINRSIKRTAVFACDQDGVGNNTQRIGMQGIGSKRKSLYPEIGEVLGLCFQALHNNQQDKYSKGFFQADMEKLKQLIKLKFKTIIAMCVNISAS